MQKNYFKKIDNYSILFLSNGKKSKIFAFNIYRYGSFKINLMLLHIYKNILINKLTILSKTVL